MVLLVYQEVLGVLEPKVFLELQVWMDSMVLVVLKVLLEPQVAALEGFLVLLEFQD